MRLFEIATPPFYLMTATAQSSRDIISFDNSIYPLGSAIENRLEQRRPANRLPRRKSLYLYRAPLPDAAFVYQVEPIGQIDSLHSAWLRRLQQVSLHNVGEVDQWVTGYWSGKVLPEARDEPWEYRCLEAKIVRSISQSDA